MKGCVSAGPVDFLDIGPYGVKYDRDLALCPAEGNAVPVSPWNYHPMGVLR